MAAPCSGDPLVCIEFVVLGIGEFLQDRTTMGMLEGLLRLLRRFRADRAKTREDAYGKHLAAFDSRRSREAHTGTPAELFAAVSTRRGADQTRR